MSFLTLKLLKENEWEAHAANFTYVNKIPSGFLALKVGTYGGNALLVNLSVEEESINHGLNSRLTFKPFDEYETDPVLEVEGLELYDYTSENEEAIRDYKKMWAEHGKILNEMLEKAAEYCEDNRDKLLRMLEGALKNRSDYDEYLLSCPEGVRCQSGEDNNVKTAKIISFYCDKKSLDLANIDSLLLTSGDEIARLTLEVDGETEEVYIMCQGEVRITFEGELYRDHKEFPEKLTELIKNGRYSEDDRVYVGNNNWIEQFYTDGGKPTYDGAVVDGRIGNTPKEVFEVLLADAMQIYNIDEFTNKDVFMKKQFGKNKDDLTM